MGLPLYILEAQPGTSSLACLTLHHAMYHARTIVPSVLLTSFWQSYSDNHIAVIHILVQLCPFQLSACALVVMTGFANAKIEGKSKGGLA